MRNFTVAGFEALYPGAVATNTARCLPGRRALRRTRPLYGTRFSPAREMRVSVCCVTQRVHLGFVRNRLLGLRQRPPLRRPGVARWTRMRIVPAWSRL